MGLSVWHLLLFLAIVILAFGPSRIPVLGRAFGEFKRNLKKGIRGESDIDVTHTIKRDPPDTIDRS